MKLRLLNPCMLLVSLLLTSSCSPHTTIALQPSAPEPKRLFTCCNLRPAQGEISDANWYESGSIYNTPSGALPYGTEVRVVSTAAKSFTVETTDGTRLRFVVQYGPESGVEYMRKVLREDDPKQPAATYPDSVQDAIFEGRVVKGMTKEQVVMAIGYPPGHRTEGMNANEWTYWANRFRTYKLQFGRDGTLKSMWGGCR